MNKKQLSNIIVALIGGLLLLSFIILYFVFIQERAVDLKKTSPDTDQPAVIIVNNSNDDRATAYPRQAKDSQFKQVGLLVSESDELILPLFGKLVHGRRDRWAYYASTDKNPLWKVPVNVGTRNCMEDDVGCDEILNGDTVNVPIYKDRVFKATIYKKDIFNPII